MSDNGKVWFITGASSGFGSAFAEYALERGYRVVASSRDGTGLAGLVRRDPSRVLAVKLDMTRAEDMAPAVEAAVLRFGRIDVLVNNAGFGLVGAIEETPMAELRLAMETMFFGAVALTQTALPTLRAQGSGAVVNMSSMGGQMSFAGFGAYSAAKFALEGASEALAQELAPFGIKVLIVEPGAFRTGLARGGMRQMPVLAVYQQVVGATRDLARSMDGTQEGDPRKAAMAIDAALAANRTPLRLQLGQDSINAVRKHSEALLAELATWEGRNADVRIEGRTPE